MPRLPKFTLSHNDKKQRWDLKNDDTNRVVRTFEHKQDATAGGTFRRDDLSARASHGASMADLQARSDRKSAENPSENSVVWVSQTLPERVGEPWGKHR